MKLNLLETEIAIKYIKDFFEKSLAKELYLTRVSAPLFVEANKGINDNLNGVEVPITFEVKGVKLEIIHSLAKWKRLALSRYNFEIGQGLYTDMNAIRKDETLDNIHSLYVDQWDWEIVISKYQRNEEFLHEIVNSIYRCIYDAKLFIESKFKSLSIDLPLNIYFITSEELLNLYKDKSPKEREYLITKEKGAVFISQIGKILSDGKKHDGRSPDYDDFELNGDILVYDKNIDCALELSSMGIRVDKETLIKQLKQENKMDHLNLSYHQDILNDKLPLTIGGGIGQSRLCMFLLNKHHIGEVQSSYWDKDKLDKYKDSDIKIL